MPCVGAAVSGGRAEPFANGVVIFSIYLKQAGNDANAPSLDASILQITKEASLLYCLPSTPFRPLFQQSKLSGTPRLPPLPAPPLFPAVSFCWFTVETVQSKRRRTRTSRTSSASTSSTASEASTSPCRAC